MDMHYGSVLGLGALLLAGSAANEYLLPALKRACVAREVRREAHRQAQREAVTAAAAAEAYQSAREARERLALQGREARHAAAAEREAAAQQALRDIAHQREAERRAQREARDAEREAAAQREADAQREATKRAATPVERIGEGIGKGHRPVYQSQHTTRDMRWVTVRMGNARISVSDMGDVRAGRGVSTTVTSDGYVRVTAPAASTGLHRLVAAAFHYAETRDRSQLHVDHINRVRDDNRAFNLRWATVAENNSNRVFSR